MNEYTSADAPRCQGFTASTNVKDRQPEFDATFFYSANTSPIAASSKYEIVQKTEHLGARIAREEVRRAMRPIF